jgi:hypothetical protein
MKNLTDVCAFDSYEPQKKLDVIDKITKYKASGPHLRTTEVLFPRGVIGTKEYVGGGEPNSN